jgi:Predicted nucleotide-binding protein containing TIR -like domain
VRARQNVVFELGFFVGKLGRERVTVLYESGVERPSDIDGLAYIALDEAGGWKLQLIREMRAAGMDIDLNRLS